MERTQASVRAPSSMFSRATPFRPDCHRQAHARIDAAIHRWPSPRSPHNDKATRYLPNTRTTGGI